MVIPLPGKFWKILQYKKQKTSKSSGTVQTIQIQFKGLIVWAFNVWREGTYRLQKVFLLVWKKEEKKHRCESILVILNMYLLNNLLSIVSYPKMTAFQTIMLFSDGAPLTPAGGSSCSLENNIKQCRIRQFSELDQRELDIVFACMDGYTGTACCLTYCPI